ncbi:MAG: hypothetical protein GX962_02540, partial [Epulopiscium sp.]|nr:hypothetical protein [Candidatus Epulonipiscium sp.]
MKKRTMKVLALFLSFIMIFGLLTACKSDEKKDTPTTGVETKEPDTSKETKEP